MPRRIEGAASERYDSGDGQGLCELPEEVELLMTLLPCRGGPLNGRMVEVELDPTTRWLKIPIPSTGGTGQVIYGVERINGEPRYLSFVERRLERRAP